MTKFPLEQAPFQSIHLSDSDKEAIVELADVFVAQTLAEYERHLDEGNGIVDVQKWAPINKFENVTVYQDREALMERRLSRTNIMRDRNSKHTDMLKLLWAGTVQGNLDDLMYAVVNPTADEAKVKAAYVESNVLDFAVLDTLVQPTLEDPFRGLQIKWAVNGGPAAMRSMVRCRDFVYLESTGMTTSSKGERIGFHILHTIGIPGAPELHEHKVIRGNITLYHLYRQKADDVVETYVKAFIDVMGDMPLRLAMKMSAKGVVSVWNLGEYCLMKKLNWKLNQRRPITPVHESDFCSFCKRNIRGTMTRRKTCKICVSQVCSRCYVAKKMYYVPAQSRAVAHKTACVCKTCLQAATFTNGLDIALGEISKKTDQHQAYSYWAVASPTSSSSSLMP